MKKLLLNILILGSFFSAFGKTTFSIGDTSFQLLYTVSVQSTYSTLDNLQNLYVANQDGQVLKYDNKGQQQFIYNNKRLGQVGKIDARNPFNILVYYPDFEVVVILDRTLSVISELNLFDLAILEPTGICLANDNNIWIFDQVSATLKKINQKGIVLFESRNLNQLTQKSINATFLIERENLLWLSDLKNGLFVFDTFGQLKQELAIYHLSQFQVINEQVVYWKDKQLFSLDLNFSKEQSIDLPIQSSAILSTAIQGNLVFITKKDSIDVYLKKN